MSGVTIVAPLIACHLVTGVRVVREFANFLRGAIHVCGRSCPMTIGVVHAVLRLRTLIGEAALPPNTVSMIGQPASEPSPWHL